MERIKDVKLRHGQAGQAVDPRSEPDEHRIKPPAAPRTSGGRTELITQLPDSLVHRLIDRRWQRLGTGRQARCYGKGTSAALERYRQLTRNLALATTAITVLV